MLPIKGKKGSECSSCGHSDKAQDSTLKLSEKGKISNEIPIIEKSEDDMLPKMKTICNKCQNDEAYYWHIQTRAADEPETRFNRCTKCKHTWRSYG